MSSKVVIHIFHADDSSLGTAAHVSERIRQVKQERGVALEVYVLPGRKGPRGRRSIRVPRFPREAGAGRRTRSCLPRHCGEHGQRR